MTTTPFRPSRSAAIRQLRQAARKYVRWSGISTDDGWVTEAVPLYVARAAKRPGIGTAVRCTGSAAT